MSNKTKTPVDAAQLKEALWETLQAVKEGTVTPTVANSVATQAREILRTVKLELSISGAKKTASKQVRDFAG